eukprot:NODE_297_length_1951_cov_106.018402_g208_i0.p1 GENE.NODE_297_length_1951_cov_106.018402_g208_i0~~NODE_297_length_1951_cov_106.018402_g208_i0.p1  ORF type:complete len:546 (+),score=202.08 NODE_297_length_1951_cov_106.018402_g208_i0:64-1638(+)
MAGNNAKDNDPPPSRDDLHIKRNEIKIKIDALQKQLDDMNKGEKRDPEQDQIRNDRQQLQGQVAEKRIEIDKRKTDQNKLRDKIRVIDNHKKELREKTKDMKCDFSSVEAVDEEIRKLEYQMESRGFSSLQKEKNMISRIKSLENSKKSLKERDSVVGTVTDMDESRREYLDQVQALQSEIEEFRRQRDELHTQLQEVSQRQNAGKEAQQSTRQAKQAVRDQITELFGEIKTIKEQFDADMIAWRARKEAERVKEREKRAAEQKLRQERAAARAEEKRLKDEARMMEAKELSRIKKLNPHEEEIASCDMLIHYLTNDQHHREKQRQAAQFDPTKNELTAVQKGLVPFKRNEAEEDAWLFGKKKKPAPKPKPKAEQTKVNRKLPPFPVAKLQAFDMLGVNSPQYTADVAAIVEELRSRKVFFESFKKTLAQVEAEEAEEERIENEKRQARFAKQAREAEEAAAAQAAAEAAAAAQAEAAETQEEEEEQLNDEEAADVTCAPAAEETEEGQEEKADDVADTEEAEE